MIQRSTISGLSYGALAIAAGTLLGACSGSGGGGGTTDFAASFTSTIDPSQSVPTPITGSALRVTIRNLAPTNGTRQTPIWMGLHDGSFDIYDSGSPASLRFPTTNALERLAEDGSVGPINEAFDTDPAGTIQTVAFGVLETGGNGPVAPGEQVSVVLRVDPTSANSRYYSYASMIIPSNDAFVANANPMAHEIYDASGNFVATDFVLVGGPGDGAAIPPIPVGGNARDAGTEDNDEIPANTAFLGQMAPDTGVTTVGGVVGLHPGFVTGGNILSESRFANANFLAPGYEFLSFSFEEVTTTPAPAAGIANYSLNSAGDTLNYSINVTGLSGPATMLHLHNGVAGATGAVELDLFSSVTENANGILVATGSASITPAQRSLLTTDSLYLNVHTALNPAGETRGQVLANAGGFSSALTGAQEVPTMPITGTAVRVSVINRAPELGTFQTPVWIGFHDGTFDIYDSGTAADLRFPTTNALERLAEDGTLGNINTAFTAAAGGDVQSALTGLAGPVSPGESSSEVFRFDPMAATNRYFSYASMVIPSNDAFVANGSPLAHLLFDPSGNFVGTGFAVNANEVLDAGTETNDEVPANTAFFGQMAPDTGMTEGGLIGPHPGFIGTGTMSPGPILSDARFTGADFAALGYDMLEFNFQEVGGTPAAPVGQATVSLSGSTLSFQISATNLTGPATMLHIHEGAAGAAGPVLFDIFASITTNEDGVLTATGTETLNASALAALEAGNLYFNLHTALNPAGEIRGQISR